MVAHKRCCRFPVGVFRKPEQQLRTAFSSLDAPVDDSPAHLCLASLLRRMTGVVIFERTSVYYQSGILQELPVLHEHTRFSK